MEWIDRENGIDIVDAEDINTVAHHVQANEEAISEISAAVAGKVDIVAGYGLSKNDYSDADKAIVGSIENIYVAPTELSVANNKDVNFDFDFVQGKKYSVVCNKNVSRIQIRNGTSVLSGYDWVSYVANTVKTFMAPANANNIRIAYPSGASVTTITRADTEISELAEDINTVAAGVGNNKAVIDSIYKGGSFPVPSTDSSNPTSAFEVVSGHKYELVATVTMTAARVMSGSTIIQAIGTQIPANTRVRFTASGNGEWLYLASNGSGTATIGDLGTVVVNTESSFNLAKINNPFKNKTMTVIGDSICHGSYTAQHPWYNMIKDRYGLSSVDDMAEDGVSYCKTRTYDRITVKVANITGNPDIIAVFAGTNDFALEGGSELGTIDDEPSNANGTTFYAAVKFSMEYLLSNYPDAKIIFITPLQRNDKTVYNYQNSEQNLRLRDYVNVIRELTEVYGITLCDLYNESQFYVFNSDFNSTYTQDGLHPNEAGTRLYVEHGIIPTFDRVLLGLNTSIKNLMK